MSGTRGTACDTDSARTDGAGPTRDARARGDAARSTIGMLTEAPPASSASRPASWASSPTCPGTPRAIQWIIVRAAGDGAGSLGSVACSCEAA
jgi:hypothetical protein